MVSARIASLFSTSLDSFCAADAAGIGLTFLFPAPMSAQPRRPCIMRPRGQHEILKQKRKGRYTLHFLESVTNSHR